jgi:hypothetical protein
LSLCFFGRKGATQSNNICCLNQSKQPHAIRVRLFFCVRRYLQRAKVKKHLRFHRCFVFFSDSIWIRTKDLLLRRQLLYPTELWNHIAYKIISAQNADTSLRVPRRRFELLQPYGHHPLKMACLPISPPGLREKRLLWFKYRSLFCDSAGIRTQDPYIKSVMLYQLSY